MLVVAAYLLAIGSGIAVLVMRIRAIKAKNGSRARTLGTVDLVIGALSVGGYFAATPSEDAPKILVAGLAFAAVGAFALLRGRR